MASILVLGTGKKERLSGGDLGGSSSQYRWCPATIDHNNALDWISLSSRTHFGANGLNALNGKIVSIFALFFSLFEIGLGSAGQNALDSMLSSRKRALPMAGGVNLRCHIWPKSGELSCVGGAVKLLSRE